MPRKPMTAASMRLRSSSSLWERRVRVSNSKLCRRNYSVDSRAQPHLHKCQEEKKEEESWNRGKRKEKPVARAIWVHGRNEGFPAGSVFDPARFQGANGESGGAGNFKSSHNRGRYLSHFPRMQAHLKPEAITRKGAEVEEEKKKGEAQKKRNGGKRPKRSS